MKRITALGELLIDFSPLKSNNEYPAFNALPGGAPCNFLAAAAANGAETAFLGKVGNDAFGLMLKGVLEDKGVNTTGIIVDDSVFTTLAFVTLDDKGDRSFSFARKPGADTCLTPDEIDYKLIDECDDFHFGTLSLTDEPSASATKQAVAYTQSKGKMISFDPNYRDKLWNDTGRAKEAMLFGITNADIIKISDEEVDFLYGLSAENGAKKIAATRKDRLCVVTCGKDGVYYSINDISGFVPNYDKVNTIDTTGAGDIFGGYFVSGILSYDKPLSELTDIEIKNACKVACTAASLSTQYHGGISSVPVRKDVIDCL